MLDIDSVLAFKSASEEKWRNTSINDTSWGFQIQARTRWNSGPSFTLVMLCVSGGIALLLGTVGIYGVIAYSVSQRTREIGIRMALGAQRGAVVGAFVRQGIWLTVMGIAIGLVMRPQRCVSCPRFSMVSVLTTRLRTSRSRVLW
jgi:predicted lysophospholipase L1 biosynthesis ABC-type transport system permease subunit